MRSRFQFVDDHRNTYEVKRLCQVLDVNRSSYYKWLAGAEARATRQREDRILAEEIREVHGESGGAVGTSADNAACESFHASLKRETLQGAHDYGDSDTCRRTVFAWLTRYNTRRRHSANGHLSPNEYEHRHHTAKLTLAA